MSILLLTSRGAAWDWLLYAAGHKETGVGNKRLIRTIDGVGGYTGLSFFNDQNNMYTAKIHSIMLKLLPEGPWRHQWTRIYEHYMEGGNNKANGQGVLIKPPQKSVAFVLVCAGVALCALSKPGGHQEAVPSLARLASDDEQLSILPGCYEL